MDMSGEYRIEAPRDRVWEALNDPEVLRRCIPGCEEIEKLSDTEFTAKARVKVGPVNAKFAGKVTLSDIDPPNGYTITGEGQGGAAGFGKGGAKVALTADGPEATVLTYTAEAQVGGKLAQIGSRLVQGTAKKMADNFFARFQEIVGGHIDDRLDAEATELLVETAEEVEARPEVASGGMPMFASVPLAAHPEAVLRDPTPEDAAAIGALAEPHHHVDDDTDGPPTKTDADAPAAQSGGLRPMVWIPLVALVLLLLVVLFR